MNNNITRNEISENLYKEIGLSKSECIGFVDEIIEILSDSIAKDGFIKIPGFGSFKLRHKKERMGRNPKTGVEKKIFSRKVVKFKPSSSFKKKINKNEY